MKVRRIASRYWKPNTDYISEICRLVEGKAGDGDILAVSEKAISVASGNIADEEKIHPRYASRILVYIWMKIIWGYILGYICHLKKSTIEHLRKYPYLEGARHKQLALERAGLLQALRFGSEGGIDASNLPYSYVSLPLEDPEKVARRLHDAIRHETGKKVTVFIVDSDKAYSLGGMHLSPTKTTYPGISSKGGFLLYLLGRIFKLKPRSTPKASYPLTLEAEKALDLAEKAHCVLGDGAGLTAWEMAEHFKVNLSGVTWQMLSSIKHHPIALFRR
jgi:F420-0:gamma-glutamyl ligase-like protein